MRTISPVAWPIGMAVLCVVLWSLSVWWPVPEPTGRLTVGIGVSTADLGLVRVRDEGLLEGDSVRMVELTWASATMREFANRVIDVAALSMEEFFRQRQEGVDLRIARVRERSARSPALLVWESWGGGSLEGARVGYPARVAGGFVLDAALRAEGLMATQVRLVPQGYAEAVEDPRRETDAQVSVEPWLTLLCKQGWNRRWEAERLENGYWTVLAVRASAWRRHPGELQRLIAVEAVAAKQVQEGQLTAEETQVLLRHLGLEEGDWQGVMQGLWWPDVEQGQEALEDLDSEFWRHTRQVHEFLTKEGTVTGAWDPSAWLWEGGR